MKKEMKDNKTTKQPLKKANGNMKNINAVCLLGKQTYIIIFHKANTLQTFVFYLYARGTSTEKGRVGKYTGKG